MEDLATGYWFSEVLFTAVEMGLFTLLEPGGKTLAEIARELKCHPSALERYLHALCALGLLTCHQGLYCNTQISASYLVQGKEDYQGDSILWRKYLTSYWRDLKECLRAGGRVNFAPEEEDAVSLAARVRKYINAMDCVARTKVKEILAIFTDLAPESKILDVGTGSGALAAGFLEKFPGVQATLMDIPHVLEYTRELMEKRGLGDRVSYCAANILEPWPVKQGEYDLIILSNIVHAYSEREAPHILRNAAQSLKPGGILLLHDFFLEHYPEKAALSDLNMLINTYNGKIFAGKWLREQLLALGLHVSELMPLETDTALLIASPKAAGLAKLALDGKSRLMARLKTLGFHRVLPIPVEEIQVAEWVDLRCRYGCNSFGKTNCPPHSPAPAKTKKMLQEYGQALLLEGEPPTRSFQKLVLQAEKEAFKAGFYKAFAFWAGPCALCDTCSPEGVCRNPKDGRPSMEGAGIDVFATVRRLGLNLRTLKKKGDYVKYFGLLLLE